MYKLYPNGWIKSDENITVTTYTASEYEPEHTHDFIEIQYIWNGSGYQVINGDTVFVERGDLLFLNFETSHSIQPLPELTITNCLLKPEFVSEELMNSENALDMLNLSLFKDFRQDVAENLVPRIKFHGQDIVEIEVIIRSMQNEFDLKLPGYRTVLKSYVYILMTKIFRAVKESDSLNIYSEVGKIAPEVIRYIEENYNRKLTLSELAKIGCYNPSYFSRIFKECFGKSVTEYINIKRISASAELLEKTDYPIETIASQTGFNDTKRFYYLFKKYMGTTPHDYRIKIKKNTGRK